MARDEPPELERCPANAAAWDFLGARRVGRPGEVRDPYWEAGCHPETVERVWDQLGPALPSDCRALLQGRPVLAHPRTGAVIAFAYGTAYALLVPPEDRERAAELGVGPAMRWAGGRVTHLVSELGEGWRFGRWATEEVDWCRRAYEQAAAAGPGTTDPP